MSKLENLDLIGVASLALVTGALLAGWIATTASLAPAKTSRAVADTAISLTREGAMKLTVTASRESDVAQAARPARVASSPAAAGPALQVALPLALRQ